MLTNTETAIFLSSTFPLILVGFLLFVGDHYLEAIVLVFLGFTALNYHYQRCSEEKCIDITNEESQIDTVITILAGIYLILVYKKCYQVSILTAILLWLTYMYREGGQYKLTTHSLWHVLLAIGVYWIVVM